jgi:hypothetical protein
MLTPKLEELILCGKAFFKTAVVGGSKTTIDIDNDRYIIITDITYCGGYNNAINVDIYAPDTQISIYGERGFNHYIFRDKGVAQNAVYDGGGVAYYPSPLNNGMHTIHCYLLHTTQVGFSFIKNVTFQTTTLSVAAYNNPAFEPPLDYGKDGMPGALNVDVAIDPSLGFSNQVVKRATGLGVGSVITQQVQFAANNLNKPVVNNNPYFPYANVNYVEILGQPNNIGI